MKFVLEDGKNITIIEDSYNKSKDIWISDINGINLLNVMKKDNNYVIKSNTDIKLSKELTNKSLSNINYIDELILETNSILYATNIMNDKKYCIYFLPDYEKFEEFVVDFNQTGKITIGSTGSEININSPLFEKKQIELEKVDNDIVVKNNQGLLYINSVQNNNAILNNGDILFINGVFMYFFGGLILISNNNQITFDSLKVNRRLKKDNPIVDYSSLIDKDIKLFNKDLYYERPPRFKRNINTKIFNIDEPTQKEQEQETPLIFTLAPMVTMGMSSLLTGITSLNKVVEGKSTLKNELPSLLISGGMMLTMIFFPLIQNFYEKIRRKQKERKRRRKYKKYIENIRDEIFKEINFQKQVLIEDNLPIEDVAKIAINHTRNLWERKLEHSDFLELRLGIGNKKPDIDIKYPEKHFTLEEDDLKDIVDELINESKDILNVPITLNLKNNNKVGIICEDSNLLSKFLDNLMLQTIVFHGYDFLRIIIFTNGNTYFEKYKNIPFVWNNEKTVRYFANNKDEFNKITSYLMEEYNYRKEMSNDTENTVFSPYYLIVTDEIKSIKNNILIKEILTNNNNLGYSILMAVKKLDILPNEVSMFINLSQGNCGLFNNEMTQINQLLFKEDLVDFSIKNCLTEISNIPLDINNGKFVLPKKYGFLEMYDVGNVNQLDILSRWKNNDIINSLTCPVGIDEEGELFNVDLHEKTHGPHGLVAGMTGSGKSEWIITYILSMAVNYSPEEVQFVLIDYKGGGLALTFDNRENNIKLPHVVGTITNLDLVEIKRSLASIEAELKRRQSMFKSAREELNESSMDIYKYQGYYRQGKLKEPMSHLFIISDEFAELKAQQPEFMDELISTARIGRSLGVHLILATQKPSGVVDDQIWSNSKFKVCLKVQDKSDSNDMIKCPDAAMLKETGRFYFQVGYNEFFAKGQSAYAGVPYYESDKKIELVDSTVDFVNNVGSVIKKGDIKKSNTQFVLKGEELPNILNYIIEENKKLNLNIRQLWLSRIPAVIYVDKLIEKYNWTKEDYILNPVIGEYDNPSKQEQGLLTIPISNEGNTVIYGSSGSGKENLVTTIIYSLISQYVPQEVSIYIIDSGTEVLNAFNTASHIGDIIHNGEDEKIENFFKMINSELNSRRKKMNGSFKDYIKNTSEKIPNIVLIFNQVDTFLDINENYVDELYELSRDAYKYGIYLILTTSSTNAIKTKIISNIKLSYVLQINDQLEYKTLLGNNSGIVPSKIFGRGLTKIDKVVEFQTAYASDVEKLYDNLASYSINIFMKYKIKSRAVPVLPDVICYSDIVKTSFDIYNIPVGIIKKNLDIAKIKLKDNISYLISSKTFDNMELFIDKFLYILDKNNSFPVFTFDSKYLYENINYKNVNYLNNNYDNNLKRINDYLDEISKVLKENNNNINSIKSVKEILLVIIGLEKFDANLSKENKELFINIVAKAKETGKVHFIFFDTSGSLKKKEIEQWYKDTVDSTNGLWIGDNFPEQFSIKATKIQQEYYKIIGNKYGYIVENGNVNLLKIIEKE